MIELNYVTGMDVLVCNLYISELYLVANGGNGIVHI